MAIEKSHVVYPIKRLIKFYNEGKLNLNPGFQRKSVWSKRDKQKLIDTILMGKPIPNIFLYERYEGHKIVFDVIDGKQRLESIMSFMNFKGFKKNTFSVKHDPDGSDMWRWDELYDWTWKEIEKEEPSVKKHVLNYEIPVVVLKGHLPEIIDVFVRINSTGKALSGQEIRHARYYKSSPLLSEADVLAKKHEKWMVDRKILSEGQLSRMKGVEFVSELMLSIEREAVLDKKKALDHAIGNAAINKNTVKRISRLCNTTLNDVKRMFPDIATTRLVNMADFYALSLAVFFLRRDGYAITDKKRSRLAFDVLSRLSDEISEYRLSFKRGKVKRLKQPAQDYHNTIFATTDAASQRRQRVKIIMSLIRSIFDKKDINRFFSIEQKQLLWRSTTDKVCGQCGVGLTWGNIDFDHMLSHSRGGKTILRNAQILCKSCNQKKGAR